MLYHDDGLPDRIGEPFDEDVDVITFGADGGGTLYGIAVGDTGTVYLRSTASGSTSLRKFGLRWGNTRLAG